MGEYAAEAKYGRAPAGVARSGATSDEATRPLPGDDLVPVPNWQATRAVTIAAPPSQVWPWLVQAGDGCGGWYGDLPWWKDPAGHTGASASAVTLLPQYQHVAPGEILLDGPNCDRATGAWTVVEVREAAALVLFCRPTLSPDPPM
jgi:hypothetical protein